jgi:hypothetical protein
MLGTPRRLHSGRRAARLGRHGWLWLHRGMIGFALITLAFALEIITWFLCSRACQVPPAAAVKRDWQRAAF